LKTIIEKIDAAYRPGLIRIRGKLLDIIHEIQSQNNMNRELFKQALSHIQNFLRRLSGLEGQAYGYGKDGQNVTKAGKNLVVNQVV
jgi:flagellar biosynthesis/type III secretory pathway chaperone